ncbi:MAG TPA: hypothetical protein VFC78_01495 [Tepidisphaeraceae bacterium]|nr:hypothetical protein [Tepidisphaeraceae bacterium]
MKAFREPRLSSGIVRVVIAGILVYWCTCLFPFEKQFIWTGRETGFSLRFSLTGIEFGVGAGWMDKPWLAERISEDGTEIGHNLLGFLAAHRTNVFYGNSTITTRWLLIGIPWWWLAAFACVPRVRQCERNRLAARWRSYRRRRGVCQGCGYDMRGTPMQCPECGLRVRPRRRSLQSEGS